MAQPFPILTVGHSTHSSDEFVALIKRAGVTAIADVRSTPYSKHNSHFSRDNLARRLSLEKIAYVFLGKELGGRPQGLTLFTDGIADYEKMAHSELFQTGLKRVMSGALRYTIALMCSEQEPLECHRCLLAGRRLVRHGADVRHILGDGTVEKHQTTEDRLLKIAGLRNHDIFMHQNDRLAFAYREQARKVAYAETHPDPRASHHDASEI